MTSRFGRTRRAVVAGGLALLLSSLLLAGCTSDGGSLPVSTLELTTSTSSTTEAPTVTTGVENTVETTSTTDDPEAAVLAALAGYNQAFSDAAQPFDPDHPDLARFITDPLLSRIQDRYTEYADLGYEGQGVYSYQVDSVEIVGDRATVLQCGLDETAIVDHVGDYVSPPDQQPIEYFTELVLEGDTWLVSEEGRVGNEDRPCDLD